MTHRLEYLRGPAKAENLMVTKLYANQAKLIFDKTAGSYVIGTVPGNSILEYVVVNIDTGFDDTLTLGNASDADAYIADADFPKTAGMHDPIILNIPISTATGVRMAVGANTTGAGTIWLLWRPLK
ncbi:MAG: hypothetical protein WC343_10400 [Bacilli bacterium]|jgi:hypothetical protein